MQVKKQQLELYIEKQMVANWERSTSRLYIVNISWIIEKAKEFQKKNIYFCLIDYVKAFDCWWITTNYGKFFKRWEYQTT